MSVDVLDRRFVAPSDLVNRHSKYLGDLHAFRGTGRPASHNDCHDPRIFQPGLTGQLVNRDTLLPAKVGYRFGHRRSPQLRAGNLSLNQTVDTEGCVGPVYVPN